MNDWKLGMWSSLEFSRVATGLQKGTGKNHTVVESWAMACFWFLFFQRPGL